MGDRALSSAQEYELEMLVDACGLDAVLGSLASIFGGKSEHASLVNWNDRALANAWLRAMERLETLSINPRIAAVSF
jgi:hypothetical protein